MPNGDGECKYCGAPGTPYGIKHKENCLFVQGQRRIDILTGKRVAPEPEKKADFCGEYELVNVVSDGETWHEVKDCTCGCKPGLGKRIKRQGEVCVDRYEVLCANCQANTYAPTAKEAIAAWNQRRSDE